MPPVSLPRVRSGSDVRCGAATTVNVITHATPVDSIVGEKRGFGRYGARVIVDDALFKNIFVLL